MRIDADRYERLTRPRDTPPLPPLPIPLPRTAEDIIRAGELRECGTRELIDLAREIGLELQTVHRPTIIRKIEAEARNNGWIPGR